MGGEGGARGDREGIVRAAKEGDEDRVRQLLARDPTLAGARTDSGETPVMSALYRGHTAIVDALVGAGAPLDLFAAAALGRSDEVAAVLRENPGAVNTTAYDGWTPLHLAAFFGRLDVSRTLLEAGANPIAVSQNSLANTPLHAAIAGKHSDVALLLIERGADVNPPDAGGHTPLHIAAEAGTVDVVKALLARGADPHAVDREDKTPLSRAAARNHEAVVDLLNS